jgi:hypothetical protein
VAILEWREPSPDLSDCVFTPRIIDYSFGLTIKPIRKARGENKRKKQSNLMEKV